MTDREKLIELLKDTRANAAWHHWGYEESADHLIANGVVISNSETPTDKDTNVPTNGDRIRAMTDEELAMIMVQLSDLDARIPFCQDLPECTALLDVEEGIPESKCEKCMMEWLRKPAEVDHG